MATGILYIMTTAVPDLIKIGITQEKQYPERMRYLKRMVIIILSDLKEHLQSKFLTTKKKKDYYKIFLLNNE